MGVEPAPVFDQPASVAPFQRALVRSSLVLAVVSGGVPEGELLQRHGGEPGVVQDMGQLVGQRSLNGGLGRRGLKQSGIYVHPITPAGALLEDSLRIVARGEEVALAANLLHGDIDPAELGEAPVHHPCQLPLHLTASHRGRRGRRGTTRVGRRAGGQRQEKNQPHRRFMLASLARWYTGREARDLGRDSSPAVPGAWNEGQAPCRRSHRLRRSRVEPGRPHRTAGLFLSISPIRKPDFGARLWRLPVLG
jgi:hypothetical protein